MTKTSAHKKKYKLQKFNDEDGPSLPLPKPQQRITRIVKPIGGRVGVKMSYLECDSGPDGQATSQTTGVSGQAGEAQREEPVLVGIDEEPIDHAYLEHMENLSLTDLPSTMQDLPGVKRKRTPGDEALMSWMPLRDRYLECILKLEAKLTAQSTSCGFCVTEKSGNALYECTDCVGRVLTCRDCILTEHQHMPYHRIKKWNGIFFEKVSLKSLGLRLQLGHQRGEKCIRPKQCHDDDFVVLDTHGIHNVGIDFCGCGKSADSRTDQLLAARLFPATVQEPRTAFTFRLLEFYELLSFESKASAFEFYQTLSQLTDNTGTDRPKDRYMVFLRATKQWRHLKLLKRAGRGHDPSGGVTSTKLGECALLCPACPHPGKNMAPEWEAAPESQR